MWTMDAQSLELVILAERRAVCQPGTSVSTIARARNMDSMWVYLLQQLSLIILSMYQSILWVKIKYYLYQDTFL